MPLGPKEQKRKAVVRNKRILQQLQIGDFIRIDDYGSNVVAQVMDKHNNTIMAKIILSDDPSWREIGGHVFYSKFTLALIEKI